jgi:hypothetical protein
VVLVTAGSVKFLPVALAAAAGVAAISRLATTSKRIPKRR